MIDGREPLHTSYGFRSESGLYADRFTMDSHTKLWKKLDAKNPAKGYGAVAVRKTWCWYETWLNRVREECEQHPQLYRSASSS